MYSFSYLEPVCCSMSNFNCASDRFLKRQVGGLVFPSLSEFSTVYVIHTIKSFSVVIEAEADVFLEFPCFLNDPTNVSDLISGSSAFLNPACTSESSQFTYCLSLTWRILSITLLACEISTIVWEFEHSLALPIFGIGMKTDLFQSCGHCRVVQICWHIECSTFTASSFRIWNSSSGIPSPQLALFIVMLPKAHFTFQNVWL